MRVHRTCLSLLLVLFSAGVDLPVRAQQPDHLNVLTALDERQKTMVANTDVEGLASLACPDLMINAPTNRILTRDQFLAMIKGGQIKSEAFERTIERITVSGTVGVVMGHELFTPTIESELGKTYGIRPLKQRYTNIYVLESGNWCWLARHANVISEQPGGGP